MEDATQLGIVEKLAKRNIGKRGTKGIASSNKCKDGTIQKYEGMNASEEESDEQNDEID